VFISQKFHEDQYKSATKQIVHHKLKNLTDLCFIIALAGGQSRPFTIPGYEKIISA